MALLVLAIAVAGGCVPADETAPDEAAASPAATDATSAAPSATPAPTPSPDADAPSPVELLLLGTPGGYARAPVTIAPDGSLVAVTITEEVVAGGRDRVVSVLSCPDPHCVAGPSSSPVASEPMWSPTSGEEGYTELYLTAVAFAPEGTTFIAFDRMTMGPGISEIEGLAQYWLLCSTAACTDPVQTQVGPVPDPDHPAGAEPVEVYGAALVDRDRGTVFYLSQDQTTFELVIHAAACGFTGGCVADPTTDPAVYTLPCCDWGITLGGAAAPDKDGHPLFLVGVHDSSTADEELVLVRCDAADCATSSATVIKPGVPGQVHDVRLAFASDGAPVLASSWLVGQHLDLHLTVCEDATCTAHTSRPVAAWVRKHWDMATDVAGTPHLVWADYETDEAVLARCNGPRCDDLVTVTTGLVRTEEWLVDLAVPSDGSPVFTFQQPQAGLQLYNCLPDRCAAFVE